jgi:D-alanine--D-alanine ligase
MSSAEIFRVAIICGGPSLERGISLNSARSVMDHLFVDGIEIIPFYVDLFKNFYQLSGAQLYSNTPSDFDFKLKDTSNPLSKEQFIEKLRHFDIIFPLIHGTFGEDGELQELLEIYNIPFVGSSSKTSRRMFHKNIANCVLHANGYDFVSVLELHAGDSDLSKKIRAFMEGNNLKRLVIKPAALGSSIVVSSTSSA